MATPIEPSQWLSMIASFLLVLALLFGTLWFLRRLGAGGLKRSGGRLAVLESLWLGPKQRIAIVRVDGREVMIAITQQQISLLTSLPVEQVNSLEGQGSESEGLSPEAAEGAVAAAAELPESSRVTREAADPALAARFRDAMRAIATRLPGGAGK
jgi:flagellar protein FliO/FliZ